MGRHRRDQKTASADDRVVFILYLRPEADVENPLRNLRAALKTLLRRFGLRAVDLREERE
jgi:hypothetical protein